MKRIYVGNLNQATTASQIENLFQQFGTVLRAGILCEDESGKSRGFGFVVMENDLHGETAIQTLNHTRVDGRVLDVKEALSSAKRDWKNKRPASEAGEKIPPKS